MNIEQKNAVSDAEQPNVEQRLSRIEDQLWMFRQEFKVFITVANNHSPERLIEEAVPRAWLQDHLVRYRFAVPYVKDKAILDMACGTGYGTACLLKEGRPARAVGADIDLASVRYAQLRYSRENLEYTYADACEKWTDDVFDVITSFETLEHVPAPDRMLGRVVEMLRPEGVFFVSSPIRYTGHLTDKPTNPYHMREWSVAEFTGLLNCFFDDVTIFGQHWTVRPSIGPLRVPQKLVRGVMKGAGRTSEQLERMHHEIRSLQDNKNSWAVRPNVAVAMCRLPHPSTDPTVLKKFSYGD